MYIIYEGKCTYVCIYILYMYVCVSMISLVLILISSTSGIEHSKYGQWTLFLPSCVNTPGGLV